MFFLLKERGWNNSTGREARKRLVTAAGRKCILFHDMEVNVSSPNAKTVTKSRGRRTGFGSFFESKLNRNTPQINSTEVPKYIFDHLLTIFAYWTGRSISNEVPCNDMYAHEEGGQRRRDISLFPWTLLHCSYSFSFYLKQLPELQSLMRNGYRKEDSNPVVSKFASQAAISPWGDRHCLL